MEALSVDTIPEGEEGQYEPKWDGFRCLAFREGGKMWSCNRSRSNRWRDILRRWRRQLLDLVNRDILTTQIGVDPARVRSTCYL